MFRSMLAMAFVVVVSLSADAVAQTVCEGEIGAAYGLCDAYCEAMDCDSDNPMASSTACGRVLTKYNDIVGSVPPCVAAAPAACPCNFRVNFWADPEWQGVGRINECKTEPKVPPHSLANTPGGHILRDISANDLVLAWSMLTKQETEVPQDLGLEPATR